MEKLKPYKAPIIIVIVFVALILILKIGSMVVSFVTREKPDNTPIVKIEATNDKEYTVEDTIEVADFGIKATHEDGGITTLGEDDVEISQTSIISHGSSTNITITLKSDSAITCSVDVKSKREKVVGFQCGYPTVTDVKAVLYSNGELCFEGTGDTLVFADYPWLSYARNEEEEEGRITIRAVTFEDGVKPTNMNGWFSGLTDLTYIDSLPDSVKTMAYMCDGCTSLLEAPDWSACESLLNIGYAYNGCTSLTTAHDLPANVRVSRYAFAGCTKLQTAPSMANAASLVIADGMYSGCEMLIQSDVGTGVTSMKEMFKDCINLKDMPALPSTVRYLDDAFNGCLSLSSIQAIPQSVVTCNRSFYNCEMMSGEMAVQGTPTEYDEMFSGAAIATKVNLVGDETTLNAMAATATSDNFYVNGYKQVAETANQ